MGFGPRWLRCRPTHLLRAPTGTGVPRWSPDGELITFASDAAGQFEIFTVPSAGGKIQNITSHPAFDHVPSFSADGKWIYFSSSRSGNYQIWKVRAGWWKSDAGHGQRRMGFF